MGDLFLSGLGRRVRGELRGRDRRLRVLDLLGSGLRLPDLREHGDRCIRRGPLRVDRAELRGGLHLLRGERGLDLGHDLAWAHGLADLQVRVVFCPDRVRRREHRVRRDLGSVVVDRGTRRAKKAR